MIQFQYGGATQLCVAKESKSGFTKTNQSNKSGAIVLTVFSFACATTIGCMEKHNVLNIAFGFELIVCPAPPF